MAGKSGARKGGLRTGLRLGGAAAVLAVLGTCASAPEGPPTAQDNLCAIFAERPAWQDAATAASLRWGAPVELVMAIIWRESNFRAQARPPQRYALGVIPRGRASSAYGFAQAIDGTWDWYRTDTGNSGADRDDFEDAADFVGWYVAKTRTKTGASERDAFSQYLAYHEGHRGFTSGKWRRKPWLRKIARQVADQTARYRAQLPGCPI